MLRTFKENDNRFYEIKIVNTETGEFMTYSQSKKIGFPFDFYKTNIKQRSN